MGGSLVETTNFPEIYLGGWNLSSEIFQDVPLKNDANAGTVNLPLRKGPRS
jgi:hypothetical protein